MKKMMIVLVGMTAILVAVPETMAGHHGHKDKGNDGLRLAAGIVNLVKYAITPAPQVVYQPAPPPVVVQRPAVIIKDRRHERYAPKRRPEPPRRAHAKPAPKKHNNHKGRR